MIRTGPKVFEFTSHTDWVNRATRLFRGHGLRSDDVVCVDQRGRICGWGAHFTKAQEDAAYPIEVFLLRPEEEVA